MPPVWVAAHNLRHDLRIDARGHSGWFDRTRRYRRARRRRRSRHRQMAVCQRMPTRGLDGRFVRRHRKWKFPTGAVPETPVTRMVICPAREWHIEDTWRVAGMKGTGSHHIVLNDHFVSDDFVYEMPPPRPCITGPYSGAIAPLVPLHHAALALGIAEGARGDLVTMARSGRRQFRAASSMAQVAGVSIPSCQRRRRRARRTSVFAFLCRESLAPGAAVTSIQRGAWVGIFSGCGMGHCHLCPSGRCVLRPGGQ